MFAILIAKCVKKTADILFSTHAINSDEYAAMTYV